MSRVITYGIAACLLFAAGLAGFKIQKAIAFEGTDDMNFKCVQEYSGAGAEPHDDYSIAEVERIWDAPLDLDMIPVGGVDLPGWAKVCQYDLERPDLLDGEYRDRSVRYIGKFQLRMEDGSALPIDALSNYYASHFISGTGLVMYPNDPSRPRVPRLVAVPMDPEGYVQR